MPTMHCCARSIMVLENESLLKPCSTPRSLLLMGRRTGASRWWIWSVSFNGGEGNATTDGVAVDVLGL